MEKSTRSRVGGAAIIVAAVVADHAFGWGLGQMMTHYAADVSWSDVTGLPWGGILSLLMFAVGLALVFWPTPKVRKISPQERDAKTAYNLGARASQLVFRLNQHRNWSEMAMELRDPMHNVLNDGVSLLIAFDKFGLAIPRISDVSDNKEVAHIMLRYFSRMAPLLTDGHLEEAKGTATNLAEGLLT